MGWLTKRRYLQTGCVGVAALLVAALIVALPLGRDHTVHDDDPAIDPVPTSVDEVAWQWDPDEDTTVDRVRPGPAGPIVLTETGAIALSGSTGDELWSYTLTERDGTRIETGTTPGGEHTLIAQAEGDPADEEDRGRDGAAGGPFETEVAVIETRTGELQERYTYTDEQPLPDLQNLTAQTWIEPHKDGLRARSINDGQTSWTYQPPEDCVLGLQPSTPNVGDATIASTEDTIMVPLYCPTPEVLEALNNSETDEPDTAPGQLVGLDARTGDPAWPEPIDLTLSRKLGESAENSQYILTWFTLSVDEQHVLAPTGDGDGDSVVETATGRGVPASDQRGSLFHFSDGLFHRSWSPDGESDPVAVTTHAADSDDVEEPQTFLSAEGHEISRLTFYTHLGQETHARASSALPLDDGLLVHGCRERCRQPSEVADGEPRPLSALYFPWGAQEPEPTTIDLPGFEASPGANGHLLPTPGAIVAVQYTSNSPSGIAPLTGIA